ncbi:MAG: hypothetical protein NTV88_03990 [Candidatus Micrarchaeota archaeon]|nr:hypothetical protein [Candidatus Micrarchaeota archaeon]
MRALTRLSKGNIKKKTPVRDQIEATKDIDRYEMGWYGRRSGPLNPAATKRTEDEVIGRNPRKGEIRSIHTHPNFRRQMLLENSAYPSSFDLTSWSIEAAATDLRYFHVASIGPDGKVMGYFSYAATKKFIEFSKIELKYYHNYEKFEHDVPQFILNLERRLCSEKHASGRAFRESEVSEYFVKKGYLAHRITPMPGYVFSKDYGFFVKA